MKKFLVLPAMALSLFGFNASANTEEANTQALEQEQFEDGTASLDAILRVRCESNGYATNVCRVRGFGRVRSVRLIRQLSVVPCIEGRTWGANNRGVWVSRGCRGIFQLRTMDRGDRWPDRGDDRDDRWPRVDAE